ncbi:MAG: hypothetical protein Q4G44_08320 [Alcaligenaceae bacterium]|nr:hypothetical protein [Alcaligenaceae bacterium]
MRHEVSIIFSPNQRLDFSLSDLDLSDAAIESAQNWLYAKWEELECEPFRPSGKVLLLDRILGIAQEVGYHQLKDLGETAENFAKNIAIALDSQSVTVDIPALTVTS